MYHLASLSIAGVQDRHLPVLLWFRNLVRRDTVQRNSALRWALLQAMLRLEAADIWPEPNIRVNYPLQHRVLSYSDITKLAI